MALGFRGRRLAPFVAAAVVAGSWVVSGQQAVRRPARPPLVVMLVVDQMRNDYIERYSHEWTGGLRRLLDDGAWFRQAAYPYYNTVTCVGHSTIGTGSYPSTPRAPRTTTPRSSATARP